MRWLVLVCVLGGCDIVLGLDERIDAGAMMTVDAAKCPADYITVSTLPSRYRFVLAEDVFTRHDSGCRIDAPGHSHLVVIETVVEAFALDQHLDLLNRDDAYWVGLTQDPDAGTPSAGWTWLSGVDVDPQLWRVTEPDDDDLVESHDEDHALMSKEGTGMDLFDAPKGGTHFAICECDDIPLAR